MERDVRQKIQTVHKQRGFMQLCLTKNCNWIEYILLSNTAGFRSSKIVQCYYDKLFYPIWYDVFSNLQPDPIKMPFFKVPCEKCSVRNSTAYSIKWTSNFNQKHTAMYNWSTCIQGVYIYLAKLSHIFTIPVFFFFFFQAKNIYERDFLVLISSQVGIWFL